MGGSIDYNPFISSGADKRCAMNFEILRQLVVKLDGLVALAEQPPMLMVSNSAIASFRQLMDVIDSLRSPESGWPSQQKLTPETIGPYVSEECYDLLDCLPAVEGSSTTKDSSTLKYWVLEDLMGQILWATARGSFLCMRLLEGIPAETWSPGDQWIPGMLRLVVLLEGKTTAGSWCLDVATGYPPLALVTSEVRIQTEFAGLIPEMAGKYGRLSKKGRNWVARQIQALTTSIVATTPSLQAWLKGVRTEWLHPDWGWQTGTLRLKLGFEWIARIEPCPPLPAGKDWIDGELLEEGVSEMTDDRPATNVAIVEVAQPVETGFPIERAVIQLADPTLRDRYEQAAVRPLIMQRLSQLSQQVLALPQPDDRWLPVVQCATQTRQDWHHLTQFSLGLLHPDLFATELAPKLLWRIISGQYDVMRLVGGITAQVLRPGQGWQSGWLRLVLDLMVSSSKFSCRLDLATGQTIAAHMGCLEERAIVQSNQWALCQTPIDSATLLAHLQHQVSLTAPELHLLTQPLPIVWVTDQADWQPGKLKLHLNWEFRN